MLADEGDCLVEEVESGVIQQWMGDQQASLLWQCLWPDLPSHAYFGKEGLHVPDASWRP